MESWEYIPGGLPRAPRFALSLYALYRRDALAAWHDATIVNMSRSGVLFSTTEPLSPSMEARASNAPLELNVVLSQDALQTKAIIIRCQCRIVRIEPPLDGHAEARAAAMILSHALLRLDQRIQ
jgi:hypothetical protein